MFNRIPLNITKFRKMWAIHQFNALCAVLHYKNRLIILLFWRNYRVLFNNYVMPIKKIIIILGINTICAVFMTGIAWKSAFSGIIGNNLPSWLTDTFLYVGMWPCLLLENIGFQITNHSSGIMQNIIGWNILIFLAIYIHSKIRRT